MRTARKRILASSLALTLAGAATATPAQAIQLTPESPVTPNADTERTAYLFALILGVLLLLAINGAIVAAARRFRAERDDSEPRRVRVGRGFNARLTGGLVVTALSLFTLGVLTTEGSTDEEPSSTGADPIEISASGQQWLWRFEYPDETYSFHDLYVPVDTPVRLSVGSTDVMHRFWVPALGAAVDAVPGQTNEMTFTAEETGDFEGRSTRFSGPAFATMRIVVHVVEPAEYEDWLGEQSDAIKTSEDELRQRLENQDPSEVAAP